MTLNKEQVLAMTLAEAEQYLKKFERHYQVDKAFDKRTDLEQVFLELDSIANTLLWLEDHIRKLTVTQNIKAGLNREEQVNDTI